MPRQQRRGLAGIFLCLTLALLVCIGLPVLAQEAPQPLEPVQEAPATQAPEPATGVTPPDPATLSAVADAARGPDIPDIDMMAWEDLALRAESALDSGTLSSESLEVLRGLLADFRADFLVAQDVNAGRIDTLRTQISALGTPQDGVEELPSVQARRASLEEQLAELRAPVVAADEAYTRANGLIIEIDSVIRSRQAERLTELGASPLNPNLWGPAVSELGDALRRLQREIELSLNSEVRREAVMRNAPAAVFFIALGLLLIAWGRKWTQRGSDWVRNSAGRGARVWSSLLALGQVLVPFVGVVALVNAIDALGILGTRGSLLLENVTGWAVAILAARWLADRLFSQQDNERVLHMDATYRREARTYAATLAILLVLHLFLEELGRLNDLNAETLIVLGFPILVTSSLIFFRLGHLLVTKVTHTAADPEAPMPMRARFVGLLGQAARILGVVSPVLASVGFGEAAKWLLYPAIITLALASLLILLQRFTSEFYRYVTRQGDDEEDSLVAVLIGFMLVLLALPLLALIWGARVADITELWTQFGEGFAIGETRFQPTDFIVFLVVFLALFSATRLIQSALRNTVLPKTNLDTGGRNAVVSGVGYIGIALTAILSISATGIDLSALAFIFTALSVGIGFGLQNIVQNFVSGIILLIERPIAEGDWIEVGGNMGYVRNISVRSTRIETFDRTDVIVPNGDLISGTVTNYTRGNSIGRVIVPVGVAYGTDTRLVERILLSVAREHDMVLMNPPPAVIFQGFGADSLDFEIRAILRDVNYVVPVKSEMNHMVYERFAAHGVEIPFAQRDVWLRNPEVLTGQPQAPKKPPSPSDRPDDAPPRQKPSEDIFGDEMPVASDEPAPDAGDAFGGDFDGGDR